MQLSVDENQNIMGPPDGTEGARAHCVFRVRDSSMGEGDSCDGSAVILAELIAGRASGAIRATTVGTLIAEAMRTMGGYPLDQRAGYVYFVKLDTSCEQALDYIASRMRGRDMVRSSDSAPSCVGEAQLLISTLRTRHILSYQYVSLPRATDERVFRRPLKRVRRAR